jgi:hypothetical protein
MIFALEKHTAEEYVRRFSDTLATLEREIEFNPRVVTLPLHPHIIAVPYRFGAFCRVLDILQGRRDTIFMTADQIADWFKAECEPDVGAQ